jgi:uncharacterized membrane protein YhaH (DUF805 family)
VVTAALRRLWKLEGSVGRVSYALAGVGGFAVKFCIDWLIASAGFGRPWTPLSYWRLIRLDGPPSITPAMFLVLFSVSVPFLWFGMAMTLLRLRDAGRSAGWAALFFVPALNVVLFMVLSLLPCRPSVAEDRSGDVESAFFAILLTVGLAAAAIALATQALKTYGIGLFVAVPFSVGYLSAFLVARRQPASPGRPYVVAILALGLLGGFLFAVAWEGILCLLMSLPLALVVALLGAYCGARSARRFRNPPAATPAYSAVALLPLLLLAESSAHLQPPLYRVDTAIVVNASPAQVWRNVVAFDDITERPEWYFRAGIAYPLRARIRGRGAGAVRRCEFTTGSFIEPIDVWNEPSLLRFRVAANPPPMAELSPYADVDPPHLHGFLISERGQFELRPLSGGRTLLVGSTWYRHHLWPAPYWRLWSDAIIHRIHLRVLRHIQSRSESHHAEKIRGDA